MQGDALDTTAGSPPVKSRLNNWNNIQYVIATAKLGSFQSAAIAVRTVSGRR